MVHYSCGQYNGAASLIFYFPHNFTWFFSFLPKQQQSIHHLSVPEQKRVQVFGDAGHYDHLNTQ